MAASTVDPRIQRAIDGALAWMRGQVGRATGDSTWAIAYPGWVGSGYAWCGGFQVAAFRQVGVDLLRCAWWFYTPYIKNFAVGIGAWITTPGNQQDGDQPLFDWEGNGVIDHVGAAWRDEAAELFRSIEGNTSSGSQGNGSGCWVRYRAKPPIQGWVDMRRVLAWMVDHGKWGGDVQGVIVPASTATGKATTATDGQLVLDQDGVRGAATSARLQQVMGTPIDGRIDRPSPAVTGLQTFLTTVVSTKDIENLRPAGASGSFVDGYLGAWTWKVFQYWFANAYPQHMKNICGFTIASNRDRFWTEWCDGVEGAWTDTALQWCLNQSWAGSRKLCAK
jgi:hypothetical protein